MIRRILLAAVILIPALAGAQEFSAEIVDLRQPGTPTLALLYSTPTKKRFDMQRAAGPGAIVVNFVYPPDTAKSDMEVGGGSGDVSIILDLATGSSTFLGTAAKTYSKSNLRVLAPSQLYTFYVFVHPNDVDNACEEWMKLLRAKGESCRRISSTQVNGRDAIEYERSCYDQLCHLWIYRKLHTLIKRESPWTSTELRNIQEAPQPAERFSVPSDYTESKYGGIIRHRDPQ